MGISHKSHGKKTDKETQSPMLKIFKDIMQKEKQDPEKTTLLKEKHERKRRHYSGSRSKLGHKPTESSSSEKMNSYKHDQDVGYENSRSQSVPFQGDKRDSWWFWRDAVPKDDPVPASDDTCSCVSCAFKKLLTTDYACAACLVVLFVVSVAAGLMLLYRSVPCQSSGEMPQVVNRAQKYKPENDRAKRKIDSTWDLQDSDAWSKGYSSPYETPPRADEFNLRDDTNLGLTDSDLSRLLDAEQLNRLQGNAKLREFYRKLLQTDLAIRGLKKAESFRNLDTHYYLDNPDRVKRSINLFQRPIKLFHLKRRDHQTMPKISNGKLVSKTTVYMSNKKPLPTPRNKRFDNYSVPESFTIEKNKVVIQYQPNPSRIVAKCSHAPKDSKSHETELKHPFYKNTQRLDELLDQFLDKKVPDIMSDQFSFDLMTGKKKPIKNVDSPDTVLVTEPFKDNRNEEVDIKDDKIESTVIDKETTTESAFESDFFDDSDGVEANVSESSTYDILLSISTIINPVPQDKRSTATTPMPALAPNHRKLMGVDAKEEDESVAYEDVKEILNDDMEGHDETDRTSDRKKRNDKINKMDSKFDKYNRPAVNNPNWKGPMPLYPEELNVMAKSSLDTNKFIVPIRSKDVSSARDEAELESNDVEYVEDYVDNNYEKLAKLAQAYSDYGVFDEKKDTDSEKKTDKAHQNKVDDGRVKVSIDRFKNRLRKSGIFSQSKGKMKGQALVSNVEGHVGFHPNNFRLHREENKEHVNVQHRDQGTALHGGGSPHGDHVDPVSEGIRIEFHPGNHGKDTSSDQSDLIKILQKHIKFTGPDSRKQYVNEKNSDIKFTGLSGFIPMMTSNPNPSELPVVLSKLGIKPKSSKESNDLLFNMNAKRSPESLEAKYNNIDDNLNRVSNNEYAISYNVMKVKRDTSNNTFERKDNSTNQGPVTDNKRRAEDDDSKLKRDSSTTTTNLPVDDETQFESTTFGEKSDKVTFGQCKSSAKGNMTMSDFFTMLSNWFSSLDGSDVSKKTTIANHNLPELTNLDYVKLVKDAAFPLYDSDLIENIGHRSRVLLSIDDDKMSTQTDDLKSDNYESNNDASTTTEPTSEENSTQSMDKVQDVQSTTIRSKRKFKRQALDDSSLIFWGDLYDEEYGVDMESSENAVLRDRHPVNRNDLFKKSNMWLQNKVKTISDRFGRNFRNGNQFNEIKKLGDADTLNAENVLKRERRFVQDKRPDFAMLTARMREVCKNTVREVENTKSKEARDDNKVDHQASTLMQQLVQLMADLVDFQVQERTCRRLPPDLQQFLIWLTSSKTDDIEAPMSAMTFGTATKFSEETRCIQGSSTINLCHPVDKPTEQDILEAADGVKGNADTRSDCLGTMHAVQDLMRQYEELSEDDKNAMTGVKDYLVHQMDFLEHRLSSLSDSNIYSNELSRYRRDLMSDTVGQVTEVANTVKVIAEDTAHTIQHEYQKLNLAMKKYRNKFKHYHKKNKSTTESLKEKTKQVVEEIEKAVINVPKTKPKENAKFTAKTKARPHSKELKGHEHINWKKVEGKHSDLKIGPNDKIAKGEKNLHDHKQVSVKDKESVNKEKNELISQANSGNKEGLNDAKTTNAKDVYIQDASNTVAVAKNKAKTTKHINHKTTKTTKNKDKNAKGRSLDEIYDYL